MEKKTLLILALSVSLLAAVGALIYFLLRDDDKEPSTSGGGVDGDLIKAVLDNTNSVDNLQSRVGAVEVVARDAKEDADSNQIQLFTVQNDTNNAVSTANQASSDASSAQTTANQALSDAQAAQTSADQAGASAGTALTQANQASSDASAAQTSASQAATDATNAQTTANQASTAAATADDKAVAAQTSATNAQTTANAANSNADQAVTDSFQALSLAQDINVKIDDLSSISAYNGSNAIDMQAGDAVPFTNAITTGPDPPTLSDIINIFLPSGQGRVRKYIVQWQMECAAYPGGNGRFSFERQGVPIQGTQRFLFDTFSGTPGVATEFGSVQSGSFQVEGDDQFPIRIQWLCTEKSSTNLRIRRPLLTVTEIL